MTDAKHEALADPCASHRSMGFHIDPCCPHCEAPAEGAGELLPCPFCGGAHLKHIAVYSEDEPTWQIAWQVFCETCHARGPASVRIGWCETEPDASFAWNRRDLQAALLSEIAALRGERDGLKNRVSCLERLGGEQSTRVMEQATRAKDAERQRDELRKALEPFAALADKFGCWSVVEVCAPEPGNKLPVIQPLPLSAFETAAALIANQGADQ